MAHRLVSISLTVFHCVLNILCKSSIKGVIILFMYAIPVFSYLRATLYITTHFYRANCNAQKGNRTEQCAVESNRTLSAICQLTNNDRLWILTLITVVSIILYLTRSTLIYGLSINASRVLHNEMFSSVLRAPARFFDTNPSGK